MVMLRNLKLSADPDTVLKTGFAVDMQLYLRLRTGKHLLIYPNSID
jgi:hypothetical protein